MVTDALGSRPKLSDGYRVRITDDWQRLLLLVACCLVAGLTALVVARSRGEVTWLHVVATIATISAGIVVAVALLRVIDTLEVARERRWWSGQSKESLDDARRKLEGEYPGIEERAIKIDPRSLVDKILKRHDGPATGG